MSSDYFTVISCLCSTLSYFILLFAYISVFYLVVTRREELSYVFGFFVCLFLHPWQYLVGLYFSAAAVVVFVVTL